MTLSLTHTFWFWHTKSDPRDLWPLRHLIRVIKKTWSDQHFDIFFTSIDFDNFWQFLIILTVFLLSILRIFDNFGNLQTVKLFALGYNFITDGWNVHRVGEVPEHIVAHLHLHLSFWPRDVYGYYWREPSPGLRDNLVVYDDMELLYMSGLRLISPEFRFMLTRVF